MVSDTSSEALEFLNAQIAAMEQQRDEEATQFFRRHLSEELVFHRADGAVIGRAAFLETLQGPSPFSHRKAQDIEVSVSGEHAVVSLIVVGTKPDRTVHSYRNIRFFKRDRDLWRLERWYNFEIGDRYVDFMLKDYEIKVAYLTSHFQRMWTRFNYFVIIEAALIGGKTVFGEGQLAIGGLVFGLCLSLLWYVMGAEDRYLVDRYRSQVNLAGTRVGNALLPGGLLPFESVGHVPNEIDFHSPVEWRFPAFSTTRLAALIPLIVSLLWLGFLLAAMNDTLS